MRLFFVGKIIIFTKYFQFLFQINNRSSAAARTACARPSAPRIKSRRIFPWGKYGRVHAKASQVFLKPLRPLAT